MGKRVAIIAAVVFAVPAPAHAAPISSAAQLYTCCTTDALQERLFEEAEASGAEYVRVDVELHGIFAAAADRPDWSHLDRMIELAERHDVKLLAIVRGTPSWLSECPNRGEKASLCAPRDRKHGASSPARSPPTRARRSIIGRSSTSPTRAGPSSAARRTTRAC